MLRDALSLLLSSLRTDCDYHANRQHHCRWGTMGFATRFDGFPAEHLLILRWEPEVNSPSPTQQKLSWMLRSTAFNKYCSGRNRPISFHPAVSINRVVPSVVTTGHTSYSMRNFSRSSRKRRRPCSTSSRSSAQKLLIRMRLVLESKIPKFINAKYAIHRESSPKH